MIDRVLSWRPTGGIAGRVDLAEVEASTLRLCREYGARLRFDRMQAEQMTGNLARLGVRAEEYMFTSSGANRLARSLFVALRDRALDLPDDDELRAQFIATRLVETGPGTVKLQNPPGMHDDIPTAVGMVVADLTAAIETGPGYLTVPEGRIKRTLTAGTSTLPRAAAVRLASQNGPRGLPGGGAILVGDQLRAAIARGARGDDRSLSRCPPAW